MAGNVTYAPIIAGLLVAVSVGGCFASPEQEAQATLHRTNATGTATTIQGWANFTQSGNTLTIDVVVMDLVAGAEHGTHIHENGDCGPTPGDAGSVVPGGAAGGHYNPDEQTHPTHKGDLGNLQVDAAGVGRLRVERTDLTVEPQGEFLVTGRAVVVHADRDDGTPPAGNAGGRMLCGVIQAA